MHLMAFMTQATTGMDARRGRTKMSGRQGTLRSGLLGTVVAAVALLVGAGFVTAAEQPSQDQILNALKPKRITRSLSVTPADQAKAAQEQRFIDSLRQRKTRSLSTSEREMAAEIAREKPNIDLEINFDYNSAQINSRSLPAVANLGKALASPELKGSVFMLGGHTDAKGGEDFNQKLSERRAEAIKEHLIQKFGLAPDTLVTVGFGKGKLKNAGDPFGSENRRVQIVNMAGK